MKIQRNKDDSSLIQLLQKGDSQAFENIFRKYYPILCAYARRFVEEEDAEEVGQDTMIWLWEKRQELQIETSLSQYLLKAVYHRALNLIAKQEATRRIETVFYTHHQEMNLDLNEYAIQELSVRIQQAVAALPETYRDTFIMHRFKGMSHKEIAELLEVSPQTVNYRISQATKLLRQQLKDYLPLVVLSYLGIVV